MSRPLGFQIAALHVADPGDEAAVVPQQARGHRADVAEALDDDAAALQLLPEAARRLVEDVHDAASGGLPASGRAADDDRLARHDTGHGPALGHRVGVHHPGHRLLVGAHVGGGDVEVGADHQDDLGGVAPGEALPLLQRELARVAADPALGAPVRQPHQGALPGHQHGERRDLAQAHLGVVAEAPLGRSKDGVMVDSVTGEYCGLSVVHADRDRDHEGPLGVPEPLVDVRVEAQPGRDLVELGQGGPEHRGVEVRFLSHTDPFR